MIYLLIIGLIVLGVYLFMRQPPFGKAAHGGRLERIMHSSNFRHGQFQNESETPALTEGATYAGVMKKFFFEKSKRVKHQKICQWWLSLMKSLIREIIKKAFKNADDFLAMIKESAVFGRTAAFKIRSS